MIQNILKIISEHDRELHLNKMAKTTSGNQIYQNSATMDNTQKGLVIISTYVMYGLKYARLVHNETKLGFLLRTVSEFG